MIASATMEIRLDQAGGVITAADAGSGATGAHRYAPDPRTRPWLGTPIRPADGP
ncbi:hypothetical protein [Mycolicibacterium lacusdiani]|uniref:hypothetical protein n=1 Tax=Mycolicibacterium lacusdiani TaxID=2895283 RepID=UPI001F383501|nr:hypothetical protein [Mycolicibacterium lacusdiani]